MFCSKCGAQNEPGTRFCASCGASLETNTANTNTGAPNTGAPNYGGNYNAYNANPYNPNPAYRSQNTAFIKERSIAVCIILSIITCGIYSFFWMYSLNEDVKVLANTPGDMSGGTVILLSIVTCGIYSLVWLYQQGSKLDQVKMSRGLPSGSLGVIYLILSIFGLGIISYCLMQNEINNLIK